MAKSDSSIEISAELLQRLHRIYRQRTDVQGQIDRCPRQIHAGETLVAGARNALEEAAAAIKRAKMAADQKQLQLKERESRVESMRGKLNTASSNREFDTLREQIAADVQATSVLSDEILEALEQIDVLEANRVARQKELTEREAEQVKLIASVNERLVVLREDLQRIETEREEAEQLVPAAAKAEYTRLVSARGEEALAPIDDQTCGGCCQMLTTQIMNQIAMSRLVRCPTCGAFLYRREQTRVG
jgi:predicted  nucleic acid-binding Zn-ribbon protein